MSISAYGSITVTDLLDTATYIYYSATNTSTLSDWHTNPQTNDEYIGIYSGPPTDGGQPAHPTSAIYNVMDISKYVGNTGPQGVSVTKTETEYYRKLAGGQAPQPSTTGSTTIPEYSEGCTYYTRTVTYLSAGDPVKGEWLEATTLTNQIKDAYEAQIAASHAELKTKKIIQDTSGVTVAAGINGADVTEGTISTYGYNTIMAPDYLGLRYNAINLAKLTTAVLEFYNPSQSSQGKKMMELSGSALKFFDVNDSTNPLMSLSGQTLNFYQYGTNTAAATLNSNGLSIAKGSIKLGSNFEVNNSGVLTAKSGVIGGWTINSSYGIYTNGKTTATSTNTGILIQKDGAIYAGKYNSTNQACSFQVTSDGVLTATSGSIAGWSFNRTSLYKNNTTPGASSNTMVISTGAASRNSIGGSSGDHDWMLSAGTGFGVTTNGVLYATGAHIGGAITATSLTIEGIDYKSDIQTISSKANSADSNWSVIVTANSINYKTPTAELKATVYHNGVVQNSGFTRAWYKNDDRTNNLGSGETLTVTDLNAYYVCVVS